MREKVLYGMAVVVIALPWLFLLEVLPLPYDQIGTALEVAIEGVMALLLAAAVLFLRKQLKVMKEFFAGKMARMGVGILFVLAWVTLFLVCLILALIGISFTL